MKVFNWIFSIFCILCLPVYGFHVAPILMCILGILSLPVKPIREKWEQLPKYKVLRPLILGISFLALAVIMPTGNTNTDNPAEISTETQAEIEQTETEETEQTEITAQETETPQIETEASAETEKPVTEVVAETTPTQPTQPSTDVTLSVANIPAYSGSPYVAINNNVPQFLDSDMSTSSYEYYSELDGLGRCGVVYACIGRDLMPTEERGNIGQVKPTGWHTVKYDCVDGKYLYNRCHLIGYQLSGENANTKNLITGTRYMNVDGMLPFENMVADYVKETGNHVMYRVTPIFDGSNLLASGVQMEAKSVEDNGSGILFNVFCYNVQPEVTINYSTGDSSYEGGSAEAAEFVNTTNNENVASNTGATNTQTVEESANTNTQNVETPANTDASGGSNMVWISETGSKYHSINNCGRMNPNKAYQMTEQEAINQGYGKCSKCW